MLTTVQVTATIREQNGDPVPGALVSVRLDRTEIDQGYVVPAEQEAVADEQGRVALRLWPNVRGSQGSQYRVVARHPETGRKVIDVKVTVPEYDTQLHTLVDLDPPPTLSVAEQVMQEALRSASEAQIAATDAQEARSITQDLRDATALDRQAVSEDRQAVSEDRSVVETLRDEVATDRQAVSEDRSATAAAAQDAQDAQTQSAADRQAVATDRSVVETLRDEVATDLSVVETLRDEVATDRQAVGEDRQVVETLRQETALDRQATVDARVAAQSAANTATEQAAVAQSAANTATEQAAVAQSAANTATSAVSQAITEHVNAANPHPQYARRTELENGTQAVSPFSGGHYTGQASGNTLTISGTPVDELTGEPKFHVGRRVFCEGEARTITAVAEVEGNTVVTVDGAALSAGSVEVYLGAAKAAIPGLSSLGSAAQYDIGTAPDQVPTNAMLPEFGGTSPRGYVTPEMFGAVGDGVTDDTNSFKDAIAALKEAGGGTLFIPRGTYLISSRLDLPSNTTLMGEGWELSKIIAADNFNAGGHTALIANETRDPTGDRDRNIVIRDLQTDIRQLNQSYNYNLSNIDFDFVEYCEVRRVYAKGSIDSNHTWSDSDEYGGRSCIHLRRAINCTISENLTSHGGYNNIGIYEACFNNTIERNYCTKLGYDWHNVENRPYLGAAIQVTAMNGRECGASNAIRYNYIWDCDPRRSNGDRVEANGIILHSEERGHVEGNHIENVNGDAIRVLEHSALVSMRFYRDLTIINNQIRNINLDQTHARDSCGIRVRGGRFGDENLIYTGVVISGNNFYRVPKGGIICEYAANVIISNNTSQELNSLSEQDLERSPAPIYSAEALVRLTGVVTGLVTGNIIRHGHESDLFVAGVLIEDATGRVSKQIRVTNNLLRGGEMDKIIDESNIVVNTSSGDGIVISDNSGWGELG